MVHDALAGQLMRVLDHVSDWYTKAGELSLAGLVMNA
ncbi:hypothetical protein EDD34_1598 [Myceligenerans xiligouense]|uniref:Uncharacterized protein n=1 Tax=Myceligenerans xiligouense TaxID=253184 RepID=A0A3N4YR65_9MICO|nr:hypothetical protein EDD34_1598 [Myceligenerans xiligouense]